MPNLNIPLDELPVKKYGGDGANFVASKKIALLINETLTPDELFFNIGIENGLYFYSNRRPPSGQMWIYYYIEGPLSELLTKRLLTDLKEKPPVLVLITNFLVPEHPIWQWLLERYEPLSDQKAFAPFKAYSLKGIDLGSRLKANSSQNL